MAILRWFIRRRPPDLVQIEPHVVLPGDGTFPLQVVGESYYQAHLEAIAGRSEDGAEHVAEALLVLDDSNPYDSQAVRVEIDHLKVGHLSRADARAYRDYLAREGHGRVIGLCQAQIRGGWDRGPADRGHFGVWLDFTLYGSVRT